MARSDVIDLEANLIHETPSARLFNFEAQEKVWLPKSAHEWDEDDQIVTLREAYAIEKELV